MIYVMLSLLIALAVIVILAAKEEPIDKERTIRFVCWVNEEERVALDSTLRNLRSKKKPATP